MNEGLLRQMLDELKGVRRELEGVNLKLFREFGSRNGNVGQKNDAEIYSKIEELAKSVEFLTHKIGETEQEVFTLKKKLE